jgi:hypothetical protein
MSLFQHCLKPCCRPDLHPGLFEDDEEGDANEFADVLLTADEFIDLIVDAHNMMDMADFFAAHGLVDAVPVLGAASDQVVENACRLGLLAGLNIETLIERAAELSYGSERVHGRDDDE